jgi:cation-transporting ATPase E
MRKPYPFSPIQFMLLEVFVIGLPSFFLALQPNINRIKGRFLANVAKNTVPAGCCLVASVIAMYVYQMFMPISTEVLVTMSSIAVIVTGFVALFNMCKPWNLFKAVMFITCLTIATCCIVLLPTLFKYVSISYTETLFLIIVCFASAFLYNILTKLFAMTNNTSEETNDN